MIIEIGVEGQNPVRVECADYRYNSSEKVIELYKEEPAKSFIGTFSYQYFYIVTA